MILMRFPFLRFWLNCIPRKLNSATFSIFMLFIKRLGYLTAFLFEWNNINLVLFTFKLSWLHPSHSVSFISSSFMVSSVLFMLSKSQKKSCVICIHYQSKNVCKVGKSFMHIANSKGPRTDPCGTPDFTINGFDRILSYSIICFLFVK